MGNLKPCPLCGGEAAIVRGALDTPRVYCTKCRCNTGGYKTEDEAVSAWNRRIEDTFGRFDGNNPQDGGDETDGGKEKDESAGGL